MDNIYKILIVDDSIDDVELILLELRRAGINVLWKHIDNEADMRALLAKDTWDIVLSDHSMPRFSSSEALTLLKEYNCYTPFVIVSGKIGEEYAVEAMKSGCYDYVMKDKLTKLPPVVIKAVEESRSRVARKVAETQLRESEHWMLTTLKSIGDAVITADRSGRVKFMNPVAEILIGCNLAETVGKPIDSIFNVIREKTGSKIENPIIKVIVEGSTIKSIGDSLLLSKNGTIPIDYNSSPIRNDEGAVLGAVLVFRDITDRRNAEIAIKGSLFELTESISRTIEFRDPYTAGHQKRAAMLARQVGEKLRLGEDKINELYIGGLLHDIGKISIPLDILSKPTKLTNLEFEFIKEHPKTGYEIIKDAKLPWNIRDIVLHHHEKLDGSGYPSGLTSEKIGLEVRIIAVCDVVEAMSTFRPYRPARSKDDVLKELLGGKGIKYDSTVVDIVAELINSNNFNPWDNRYHS